MRFVASALVLALAQVACGGQLDFRTATGSDGSPSTDGGRPKTDAESPAADSGPPTSDGGAPATDAATDAAPDGGAPSEATCERLVKAFCSGATGACCTAKGFPHDPEYCNAAFGYWCNTQLEAVSDGVLTYDGTQLEGCAAAYEKAMTSCDVHWLEWAKASVPCAQLFNGKAPPGSPCSSDLDCRSEPGFSAFCDTSTNRCRAATIVGAGAPCNLYGYSLRYCDLGLYCDVTSTTPTCKPAKALGEACDSVDDIACGYDRTCKDGKCAPGLPGGANCTQHLECESWSCQAGKCDSSESTLVNASVCAGS